MLKIISTALLLAFAVPAIAQEVPAPSVATQCGKEWKEFKATNGKPAKGEGREAWNAFYTACRAKKAKGITVQDKAALAAKIEAYSKQ